MYDVKQDRVVFLVKDIGNNVIDAIGRALENFINGDQPSPKEEKAKFEIANNEETNHTEKNKDGMECIECNSYGVVNEGGCLVCKDCGWSKCQ